MQLSYFGIVKELVNNLEMSKTITDEHCLWLLDSLKTECQEKCLAWSTKSSFSSWQRTRSFVCSCGQNII